MKFLRKFENINPFDEDDWDEIENDDISEYFFKFLKDRDLYERYMNLFNLSFYRRKNHYIEEYYSDIDTFIENTKPENFIFNAFIFWKPQEWFKTNEEWLKILKKL